VEERRSRVWRIRQNLENTAEGAALEGLAKRFGPKEYRGTAALERRVIERNKMGFSPRVQPEP
jgi:hypothetical protein